MTTKANSKHCQTSEIDLFPRRRYWLQRQTQDVTKDEAFCKKLKAVYYLRKNLHLGCLRRF